MKLVSLSIWMTLFLSGCVKLHILPDGSVKQGIHATKRIIGESRLKHSGGIERTYQRQESITAHASRDAAEKACLSKLRANISEESRYREAVIASEKMGLVHNDHAVVECTIEAFVWPNA